jgi:hypothetical protein
MYLGTLSKMKAILTVQYSSIMWNKLFCDIADAHAPVKRRRVKGTQVPWMNSKISEAMQDCDYHHRKAVKSNKTYHWNIYV